MSSSGLKKWAIAATICAVFFAVVFGAALGLSVSAIYNTINQENLTEFNPALPTRLLDINGELITEYTSEQKREIIAFDELPPQLVNAALIREDQMFYSHRGFSAKAILRALLGQILGKNMGGGSTITQQLAGTLYCDRTDISIARKIKELWWALQLERRYTKNEILELYLNEVYFGGGTAGVEAASKYYFGHTVREITPAEAAILVIQLSNPAGNNPFDHPDAARFRQIDVLAQMTEAGYLSAEEADYSFNEYWNTFDYTRVNTGAYFMRDDRAPWFSEYVRRQLNDMLYGTLDYTKDGFTVHTTLDLKKQAAADKYMERGIKQGNSEFRQTKATRFDDADSIYIPLTEMLSLVFDVEPLAVSDARAQVKVKSDYMNTLHPTAEALSLVFGLDSLKTAANRVNAMQKSESQKTTVEGALITLENDTGYIVALVGGSKYGLDNQNIRATQAKIQPGSTFKPLLYSAAIDSRKFTAATQIADAPVIFYNDAGTPYIPTNYRGEWTGSVLVWRALSNSMNVPSVKILDGTGFDAVISRASALLDITSPDEIEKTFPRVYSLALGVISVTPLQMARAFAVFSNQGKEVSPIAIRSVEDRSGRTILDPEKELRIEQKRRQNSMQVVSPQNAYIMTSLLRDTVKSGTLAWASGYERKFTYKDSKGASYTIPAAGKTGTTQNWADAWTVGYTPYYTTAVWFGFDLPGNSLGTTTTGATLAGPVWADYMSEIHQGLPYRNFLRPQSGLVEAVVCAKSGLLPTEYCNSGSVRLLFLEGTQPSKYCEYHEQALAAQEIAVERLRRESVSALTVERKKQSNDDVLTIDPAILKNVQAAEKAAKKNKTQNAELDSIFNDLFAPQNSVSAQSESNAQPAVPAPEPSKSTTARRRRTSSAARKSSLNQNQANQSANQNQTTQNAQNESDSAASSASAQPVERETNPFLD